MPSIVSEIFNTRFDFFCITETWLGLRANDIFLESHLVMSAYENIYQPRPNDHPGVSFMIINCSMLSCFLHPPFWPLRNWRFLPSSHVIYNVSLIYRLPISSISFITELGTYLQAQSTAKNHILVGDFNLHVDDMNDSYVKCFINLLCQ